MKNITSTNYTLSWFISDGHKFTDKDIQLLKDSLKPWFRFLKEQNVYLKFMKLTSMDRLLGVMYSMRHWSYQYPCPVQHTFSMHYREDNEAWFDSYRDPFKSWCVRNQVYDYQYDLSQIKN